MNFCSKRCVNPEIQCFIDGFDDTIINYFQLWIVMYILNGKNMANRVIVLVSRWERLKISSQQNRYRSG